MVSFFMSCSSFLEREKVPHPPVAAYFFFIRDVRKQARESRRKKMRKEREGFWLFFLQRNVFFVVQERGSPTPPEADGLFSDFAVSPRASETPRAQARKSKNEGKGERERESFFFVACFSLSFKGESDNPASYGT